MTPPLVGFEFLLEQIIQLEKHLHLPFYYVIKNRIKNIDEQLGEGIHRLKSRRALSAGPSVRMRLEYTTLLAHECVH